MKIERVPPPKVVEPEFVLTLTRREILALSSVTGYIGGEPEGPRGVFDELSLKVQAMNLPHYKLALRELGYRIDRNIKFEEAE